MPKPEIKDPAPVPSPAPAPAPEPAPEPSPLPDLSGEMAALKNLVLSLQTTQGGILEQLKSAAGMKGQLEKVVAFIDQNPTGKITEILPAIEKLMKGETDDSDPQSDKPSLAATIFDSMTMGFFSQDK